MGQSRHGGRRYAQSQRDAGDATRGRCYRRVHAQVTASCTRVLAHALPCGYHSRCRPGIGGLFSALHVTATCGARPYQRGAVSGPAIPTLIRGRGKRPRACLRRLESPFGRGLPFGLFLSVRAAYLVDYYVYRGIERAGFDRHRLEDAVDRRVWRIRS